MSQVRENSKCGVGDGETHVEVPTTSSTSATTETSDSLDVDNHRPNDMEVSIRIPTAQDEYNHHDGDENEDSDPPVENYEFHAEYLNDDDEEDDIEDEEDGQEDSNNNTSPGHDWLAAAAQEHRRLIQRRRAHGYHHRKRKRSNSNVDANYVPPYKKRFRRHASVLPSKFLLGGNIRDPLNLASLADAKVNAALNAETPKSSPVPIPMYRHGEVPVFIPKNPDDPLGLQTETENPYDFIAGIRSNKFRKHRHRKKGGRKRTDSECSIEKSEGSDGGGGKEKDISGSSEEDLKIGVNVQPKPEHPDGKIEPEEAKKGDEVEKAEIPAPPPAPPPKKKSRTRKRPRKGSRQMTAVQEANLLLGKSSDYVPLGTPSVHEASQFYEDDDSGQAQGSYEPFESPLVSYCTSIINQGSLEPFSPPPKPEVKRRRLETEPEVPGPSAAVKTEEQGTSPKSPESSKAPTADGIFVKPQTPPVRTKSGRSNRKRFRHKADPIVSPVIPQPGSRRFPHHHHHHHHHRHPKRPEDEQKKLDLSGASDKSSSSEENNRPKFRKKDEVFQFGNYNRYYGYRTTDGDDLRLRAFPRDFFHGKDILDVGCNIGHVTLLIARDYGANFVQGIDIDPKLIEVAKKNVKHYVDRDPSDETVRFPHSCPLMYGVLQPPPGTIGDKRKIPFPYNVSFKHENYVLESDEMLKDVKPEYDVILCLSITKWVHLNNGDDGLKRFFRRAFLHLRPGGKLVLEPQPWSSYKRKKKLTERIFENFKKIRFYPEKFADYLLKEVGFATVERLATPLHHAKGFQRPLVVFTKLAADAEPHLASGGSFEEPDRGIHMEVTDALSETVPAAAPTSSSTDTKNDPHCSKIG